MNNNSNIYPRPEDAVDTAEDCSSPYEEAVEEHVPTFPSGDSLILFRIGDPETVEYDPEHQASLNRNRYLRQYRTIRGARLA